VCGTLKPSQAPFIVWFRQDLRMADNPALHAALQSGGPVIPVFIWSPAEEGEWQPGGASRWWQHQSLVALDSQLIKLGARLIVRQGESLAELIRLISETGAKAVVWNRRYEPAAIARDAKVKSALRESGIHAESFNGALLHEPWTIQNQSGKPFQVFTPFWKHCLAKPDPAEPLPPPVKWHLPTTWQKSLPVTVLALEPKIQWADGLRGAWNPGETGAQKNLERFVAASFKDYSTHRNRPDIAGTSRLSPHLHFGEISPRQIWSAIRHAGAARRMPVAEWRSSQFMAEIGWREFAHHLLFHFPHTPTEPLRADFNNFPWRKDDTWLRAWQKGMTGFPIVDAGMRELWATGWMHNRVRMIVASFLVKDLLLPWQEGARWFWDTLVDADLAQNTSGWQWTAGCGADAAPYFRVFNPQSQGEKFDPNGEYVRRWCPELAKLPAKHIHAPDKAPPDILACAGVRLGVDYPEPIVSHAIAREVALEAFAKMRGRDRVSGNRVR
jgi:deoxyribodipyrimidine photo-lyase